MNTEKHLFLDFDVINNLKELGGDDPLSFLKEIVVLYNDQFPVLLNNLKTNLFEKDNMKLSQTAHALKGASLNIGAKETAALCKEIESKCNENAFDEISGLIIKLEQVQKDTMDALDELYKQNN
jgi:HPt (histidine-containing phosphotransfer) domain-containing protein